MDRGAWGHKASDMTERPPFTFFTAASSMYPRMSKCTSTASFALFQEDFFPFVGTEVIMIS